MLPIHVTAGLAALIAGAIALIVTKGSSWHRRSGDAFVAAMLVLASTGTILAALKPDRGTAMGGVLTFYLVSTAALTVKRSVEEARGLLTGLMLVALLVCIADTRFAYIALNSPNSRLDAMPAPLILMFAIISFFCVVGDVRMLLARRIEGARRLVRHLWRMCFAMWIATAVVPVLVTMFYWLARVAIKRQRAVALPLQATQVSR